jgi:hypothetical protein
VGIALAGPASATEVVQVRVGQHPEYTRVVFELDGPAGYRLEKRGSQLRVTLDARSGPRSIRSRGNAVKQVKVERAGDEAVALIDLHRADLAVKEMILSSPSRIVLDVMRPEEKAVAKATPKPAAPKTAAAPKPAPAPLAQTPKPAPAPLAQTPKPAPATPAAEPPKPVPGPRAAEAPKPAPAPQRVETTAKPAADALPARPLVVEQPAAKPPAAPPSEATPPKPAVTAQTLDRLDPDAAPDGEAAPAGRVHPQPAAPPSSAAEALRERIAQAQRKGAGGAQPAPTPTPRPVAKMTPAAAKPPVVPPGPPAAATADWMQSPAVWGAAAGLLIFALLVVVLMRRRRPLPNDLDVTAIAGATDDDGGERSARDADRSFTAGLFDDEADADTGRSDLPIRSSKPTTAQARPPVAAAPAAPAPEAAASPMSELDSLFEDLDDTPGSAGMGDDAMATQQGISDLPADPGATKRRPPSPPPAAAGAGPDPDVLRIVHDLERRMGQLEAKLAESNEARERLERQVAAQSEELRVQRAAIARTQRALRTMSRGDEEKATEPALREGETQARTRINL